MVAGARNKSGIEIGGVPLTPGTAPLPDLRFDLCAHALDLPHAVRETLVDFCYRFVVLAEIHIFGPLLVATVAPDVKQAGPFHDLEALRLEPVVGLLGFASVPLEHVLGLRPE